MGQILPFSRLIPTFADRCEFYKAILCPQLQSSTSPISKCKKFFITQLRQFCSCSSTLQLFVENMLDGLQLLHFQIQDDGSNQSIYQGLAKREQFLALIQNPRPGINMSPLDLIRNYLLQYFPSQSLRDNFLHQYWLPLESVSHDSNHLQKAIKSFLIRKGYYSDQYASLYDQFSKWFNQEVKKTGSKVAEIMESLIKFCRTYQGK